MWALPNESLIPVKECQQSMWRVEQCWFGNITFAENDVLWVLPGFSCHTKRETAPLKSHYSSFLSSWSELNGLSKIWLRAGFKSTLSYSPSLYANTPWVTLVLSDPLTRCCVADETELHHLTLWRSKLDTTESRAEMLKNMWLSKNIWFLSDLGVIFTPCVEQTYSLSCSSPSPSPLSLFWNDPFEFNLFIWSSYWIIM